MTYKKTKWNDTPVHVLSLSLGEVLGAVKIIEHDAPEVYSNRLGGIKNNNPHFYYGSGAETVNAIKAGDRVLAGAIETKLKSSGGLKTTNGRITKSFYDIAGGAASVPRYVQGLPDSMINTKFIAKKNKVVNIVKSICFNCGVPAETIKTAGLEAINYIYSLEKSGYKVNYSVLLTTQMGKNIYSFRIKIKESAERFNSAKMAFFGINPDAFRRVILAYMDGLKESTTLGQTIPAAMLKDYINDYSKGLGCPVTDEKNGQIFDGLGEYYINANSDNLESLKII